MPDKPKPFISPAPPPDGAEVAPSGEYFPLARAVITSPVIMGQIVFASPETQTTVGAAGGASALPATPTGYIKFMIGNTEFAMPYYAVS